MTNPPLWKASVALAKADAADTASVLELEGSAQAVLIAEEPFTDHAVVEALYTEAPDAAFLSRLARRAVTVEPLPDRDWIKLSQEGLPPVRAGRFFVHGSHDAGKVPAGVIPLLVDAGQAFGTGHHQTTTGCLEYISELVTPGLAIRALDIGTGTGVLAVAVAKLARCNVLASDIDPVAVRIARDNARKNGVGPFVAAMAAGSWGTGLVMGLKPDGTVENASRR